VLAVLVVVQFLFSLGHGKDATEVLEGSLETFIKQVSTKRVALVMPLHKDETVMLKKRFEKWNGKRKPCLNGREHHQLDMVFYLGTEAGGNREVIDKYFTETPARACFREVRFITLPQHELDRESEETYAFFRFFELEAVKSSYDVFMYMSPRVWQVKAGWADKIFEEAVVSDPYWVRGSTAMATCPKNALTADGDCDGSINLGFPAVMHININALYALGHSEFDALRIRAEKRFPKMGADIAMFKELVSTDHPLTSKLHRGAQRKPLGFHPQQKRPDDASISHARSKSGHVTSLYWPAHAHRYQYTDFVVNALAGKKHFKQDLQNGLHPNTFLVHQGLSE